MGMTGAPIPTSNRALKNWRRGLRKRSLRRAKGRGRLCRRGCVGAALATVLSWSANHAIILAALHGLLSWLYVVYYVATRWGQVKFF
jgi:hypothetical protein